jgi:ketosteroid isomerase-like protein
MKMRDGKVVRGRSYFDMGSMMRQLGLIPDGPTGAPA